MTLSNVHSHAFFIHVHFAPKNNNNKTIKTPSCIKFRSCNYHSQGEEFMRIKLNSGCHSGSQYIAHIQWIKWVEIRNWDFNLRGTVVFSYKPRDFDQ